MTKTEQIMKWMPYGAALLVIFFLETQILNRISVFGVVPALIPVAVALVAADEGPAGGAWYGFAAGLLWDISHLRETFFLVLAMTLAGLIAGWLGQKVSGETFLGSVGCCALVLAGFAVARVLFRIQTVSLLVLFPVAAAEFCYSLLFAGPLFLCFKRIQHRSDRTRA